MTKLGARIILAVSVFSVAAGSAMIIALSEQIGYAQGRSDTYQELVRRIREMAAEDDQKLEDQKNEEAE